MDREQIRQILENLAENRDEFYKEFLSGIDTGNTETAEKIWRSLERQNFQDKEEIIVYFEGRPRL